MDKIDTRGNPEQRAGLRRAVDDFAEARKVAGELWLEMRHGEGLTEHSLAVALHEFAVRARRDVWEAVDRAMNEEFNFAERYGHSSVTGLDIARRRLRALAHAEEPPHEEGMQDGSH